MGSEAEEEGTELEDCATRIAEDCGLAKVSATRDCAALEDCDSKVAALWDCADEEEESLEPPLDKVQQSNDTCPPIVEANADSPSLPFEQGSEEVIKPD